MDAQMLNQLMQIARDFAEFWGAALEPLRHIADALNGDRTFDRAVALIGAVAAVVVWATA